jgi:hypothetical protein
MEPLRSKHLLHPFVSAKVEDLQGVTYAKLNIHKLFKVAFVPAEEPLGSYDYAPLKV